MQICFETSFPPENILEPFELWAGESELVGYKYLKKFSKLWKSYEHVELNSLKN